MINGTPQEIAKLISWGTPAYETFWVESTGNQTYTHGIDFGIDHEDKEPRFFDISNTGIGDLTIEINGDGVVRTVVSGSALGAISIYPSIETIDIQATSTFTLLLRK